MLIGALSFGGGYGTLALIDEVAVEKFAWISENELHDVIILSEVTPGPIALNAATFTGYKAGGFLGALAATVGCVIPSCVLMAALTYVFVKYKNTGALGTVMGSIKPAVCSLVFSAFLTVFLPTVLSVHSLGEILSSQINVAALLIFVGAFVLCETKKLSPILIILGCGLCGVLLTAF